MIDREKVINDLEAMWVCCKNRQNIKAYDEIDHEMFADWAGTIDNVLALLKEQKEVEHVEKDVTYPADMLTPGDVMASIGFSEQIAGHIGEMLLENGAVRIETFDGYEGPYHMVRFHLSADVVKQKKEGEQE